MVEGRTFGRFACRAATCALVAVAASLVLSARVGVAEGPAAQLRFAGASSAVREITLETSTVAGASSVALMRDGLEVARVATADGDGVVRFDDVEVASENCTFTAVFLSGSEEAVGESLPLAVAAHDFAPDKPVLRLARNQVVGANPVVRGVRCPATTKVTLLVNGVELAAEPTANTGTAFEFHVLALPYLSSTVVARASNAWGTTSGTSYAVWNLGRTPRRSTYILVDKSEFRLFQVKSNIYIRRYSVSVGTPRTPTPTGEFVITKKHRSTRSQRSGMGAYWLRLEKITTHGLRFSGYFIHGTSWVRAIGKASSLGCVDLLDPQILKLGPTVAVGTHVLIRQ